MGLYIPTNERGEKDNFDEQAAARAEKNSGGDDDHSGEKNSSEEKRDSDQIDTKGKALLYLKDILSFLKIKAHLMAAKLASEKSDKAFRVFASKTKTLNKKYAQRFNSLNEGSIMDENFIRTDIRKILSENFGTVRVVYKAGLEISDFTDDIKTSTGVLLANSSGSPIRFYNSSNNYVGSLIFDSITLRNKFMNRYYYEKRDAQIKKNLNGSNFPSQSGSLIKD